MSGRQGRLPSQGAASRHSPQFAGERFVAGKLDRSWRRVALGEFDARQADALTHRHEQVAAVGVVQGMAEHGVALHAVMHVMATLKTASGMS
jgi:hypothetical protein